MLIGKFMIADWLAVAWDRSVVTGKQRLLTTSSGEKLHFNFKTFCMGKHVELNY